MHPSKPLSIALALSLTGTATAQVDIGGVFVVGNPADRVYTHDLINKTTTDVATGEVTNDLIADVVAVMDGAVELVLGPLYMNVQIELPLPAGHAAAIACTTHYIESTRYQDAVASTDLGLVRWSRDSSTGDYSAIAVPGSANWAGALQLFIADVFPGPADEIVGMFQDVNGDTLVRVASLDSTGLTELASGLMPGSAISLHEINRDSGTPRNEIAVLYGTAAFYLRSQGSQLNAFDVDFYMDTAICAAPIDDSRGEALAVVHEVNDSGQISYELGVYRTNGAAESRISLGTVPIHEIASGKTAGDDGIDVVTVSDDAVQVWRNISAQGGDSFTLYPNYPTSDFDDIAYENLAGLALTDFDGDGDADIYIEREQSWGDLAIAHVNPSVSQYIQAPLIQKPDVGDELDESNSVQMERGPSAGTGQVGIRHYNLPNVQAQGYTHILTELWMPGRQPILERDISPIPSAQWRDLDLVFPTAGLDFFAFQYGTLICRGVTLDANGKPLTAGPAMRYGFDMGQLYTALRTNTIGEGDPPDDPPPPGNGRSGAPGSGSPPGF